MRTGGMMCVIKVIETVCTSKVSWQDAVEQGLVEASKTIRNIVGIDVVSWKAHVDKDKITEYRVDAKIAYKIEESR